MYCEHATNPFVIRSGVIVLHISYQFEERRQQCNPLHSEAARLHSPARTIVGRIPGGFGTKSQIIIGKLPDVAFARIP